METIRNTPSLVIENLTSLPRGIGAKYLECIRSHEGQLIAKQWRRKLPKPGEACEVLVVFGTDRNKARRDSDEAMRSIGMVKVKGALGGTYWE